MPKYGCGTIALAFGALLPVALLVGLVRWRLNVMKNTFMYQDFVADHRFSDCEVGVALRLSRAGLLGGDPRRYVVVVRDRQGQIIESLFLGHPSYPDPPAKPVFVCADGPRVTYDVSDSRFQTPPDLRTFQLDSKKGAKKGTS
ncbi:MAG: hypothetical protein DWQ37_09930 [Planctomycetota bacterium]|nr:MAG: hypothetical protein DWQ37_09930 [Planctomycetota bacterium]